MVRQFVGQGECRTISCQRLVRIAQYPQYPSSEGKAGSLGVLSIEENQGTVLLGVQGYYPPLHVGLGGDQLSKPNQSSAQEPVRPQEECGVLGTLGQGEELLRQIPRCVVCRP